MNPSVLEIAAGGIFAIAVLHTFLASSFKKIASRFPEGSIAENVWHLLGEVEVVFGLWAGVLLCIYAWLHGSAESVAYLEARDFTEPLFVFAIMVVSSSRPVVRLVEKSLLVAARAVPLPRASGVYFACLFCGPLLGSFVTEPAAMSVTALALREFFFKETTSTRFKYVTLGTLLVNVSIGGAMTPFAAPPILMVAKIWNWSPVFVASAYGWKVALACLLNAAIATLAVRADLRGKTLGTSTEGSQFVPAWLTCLHVAALAGIVVFSHHAVVFLGVLMLFLGITDVTREYQSPLKLRESLLVSFFLAGLVVLGGLQRWWLQPLLGAMEPGPLFLMATALTAVTDNAALTYLGAQVPNVSAAFQYALVAGAIAGGGLTVMANAPNPVAFSVLQTKFGAGGIRPTRLALAAALPTLVAMAALWLL